MKIIYNNIIKEFSNNILKITSLSEFDFTNCSDEFFKLFIDWLDIIDKYYFNGREYKIYHSDTFKNCKMLTSIDIPNSVKEIIDWTFSNCKSLKSVNIPNSVTKINKCTFVG